MADFSDVVECVVTQISSCSSLCAVACASKDLRELVGESIVRDGEVARQLSRAFGHDLTPHGREVRGRPIQRCFTPGRSITSIEKHTYLCT